MTDFSTTLTAFLGGFQTDSMSTRRKRECEYLKWISSHLTATPNLQALSTTSLQTPVSIVVGHIGERMCVARPWHGRRIKLCL